MDTSNSTAYNSNNNSYSSTYSFVGWIATIIIYIVFLIWALTPEEYLIRLGITYFPHRICSLIIPSYLIMLFIVVNIAYIGYNLLNTLDPEDIASAGDSIKYYNDYYNNSCKIRSKYNSSSNDNSIFFIRDQIPDIDEIDPLFQPRSDYLYPDTQCYHKRT